MAAATANGISAGVAACREPKPKTNKLQVQSK